MNHLIHIELDRLEGSLLRILGLVERRGEPIDAGLERLAVAAGVAARLDPSAMVEALLATALAPADRFDDICVLVLRVG